MNQDANPDKALFERVKDKFDRVLKRHIRRLLDTSESDHPPPYSLNMIVCLLILAEREKEIAVFPGSPPERYTRQTFLKDLREIGIDPDDSVMVEIQDLAQAGYILIGANDEYRVGESSQKFLSLLDAIFPSMQGLSLVAYILQAVEEVITNRKDLIHAIRQFDETLLTQGQSVSKQRYEAIRRQRAEAARKKDDPATLEQRKRYLEKLNALRSRRADTSGDPAIVTTTGYSSKVEVRDLFPKGPDEPKPAEPLSEPPEPPPQGTTPVEEAELPPTGDTASDPPAVEAELPPTGDTAPDAPVAEAELPPTGDTAPDAPVAEAELPPPGGTAPDAPAMEAESPPELSDVTVSAPPPSPQAPPTPAEPQTAEPDDLPAMEDASEEDEIAKRIKAFEEGLAMACPVCKEGKILADRTEKGKAYYYCSNKDCNLVTWGKPYHVSCPICGNPFLVEFQQQEGGIGLKCPRGTCNFVHRDFDGKHLPGTRSASEKKPARKVAVRRKGGKRAVRRVVRRK